MWWVRRYVLKRRQRADSGVAQKRFAELDRGVERQEAPGFNDIKEIDTLGERYEAAELDFKSEKDSKYSKDEKRVSRSSSVLETLAHLFFSRNFWS